MSKKAVQNKRLLRGIVISDNMQKTVVVNVERSYVHPRFDKVIRTTKKYKVHDEKEDASVGDVVEIYEGRPVSKTKYMYLERVVDLTPSGSMPSGSMKETA